MKRFFDVMLAIVLMPMIVLVSIPIAIAIKLDSRGPALFKQVRVGRHKRAFRLLKWRTMAVETGDMPSHEASPAQITRLGKLLRSSKVDELPQVWNVIVGDMSFVGPRPCLPSQIELIAERDRLGVYSLRPGITGVGQLAGLDMSDPYELASTDSAYLCQQGLLTDIKIIIRTIYGRGGDAIR